MPPLAALVSLLPVRLQDKAKTVVVALGSIVGILTVVIDGTPKWLTVATIVATVLGVYQTPNLGYADQPVTKGS